MAISLILSAAVFATVRAPAASAADLATQAATWVDFTGDGKADVCRRTGPDTRIQCTVSTGDGFSQTITSEVLDWGYDTGVAWVDANGDGKADYCRRTGMPYPKSKISCTLSTGSGYGTTFSTEGVDWGYDIGRAWVDADGDGKADYCRRVGMPYPNSKIQCTLSTGSGFGMTFTSNVVDWGYDTGLAWVDANGDAKADYCRRVGIDSDSRIQCTLSTGSGFGATFTSGVLDWGYDTGRAWVDANGDARADYCRRVGIDSDSRIQCTLSTGSGFGATFTSGVLDWGYDTGRAWVDANGDGKADYCRQVAPLADRYGPDCTLSTGTGFGAAFGPTARPFDRAHLAYSRIFRELDDVNLPFLQPYVVAAEDGATYEQLLKQIVRDYVTQAYDKIFRYRNDPQFSPTEVTKVEFNEQTVDVVFEAVRGPGTARTLPLPDGRQLTANFETIWTYVAESRHRSGGPTPARCPGSSVLAGLGPAARALGLLRHIPGPTAWSGLCAWTARRCTTSTWRWRLAQSSTTDRASAPVTWPTA